MTANNATLTANKTVGEIRLNTMRGFNTVEKAYKEGEDEFETVKAVLDLAEGIPNPIGALQEENSKIKAENDSVKNENITLTKAGESKDKEIAKAKSENASLAADGKKKDAEIQKLNAFIEEQKKKIAKLLTGESDQEMTDEMVSKYPEWQVGLSVDAGDAYRVGNVLYIAKQDHVTSADNDPTKDTNAVYWMGGSNKTNQPAPVEGYKYAAGTELEYMGVMYYALVNTNDGPEVGYPTWDLVANKPSQA